MAATKKFWQEPTVTSTQAAGRGGPGPSHSDRVALSLTLPVTQFFQGKGFEDALVTHQLRADHAMRRHLSTIATNKDHRQKRLGLEDYFPDA